MFKLPRFRQLWKNSLQVTRQVLLLLDLKAFQYWAKTMLFLIVMVISMQSYLLCETGVIIVQKKAKKAKAQVLGIAPLNMRSMCQRRFTIVEVVTDQHWL